MTTSPRWRVGLASAASAAVLSAAPLVGAQTSHAQPYPPSTGLTLSTTSVPAGGELSFRGTGFADEQLVTASLLSREIILGRFRADSQGVVTGTVTIPRSVEPGDHTFKLRAWNPDRKLSARITVLPSGEQPEPSGKPYEPGEHDWPGHHEGHHEDHHEGHHEEHHEGHYGGRPAIADMGGDKALAPSVAAAGLFAVGAGTMLVLRRRRSS